MSFVAKGEQWRARRDAARTFWTDAAV
jgi:hypothetical protein